MSVELPCLRKLANWTWRALSLNISTRLMIPRKARGSKYGIATIRRWSDARSCSSGSDIGSRFQAGIAALWHLQQQEQPSQTLGYFFDACRTCRVTAFARNLHLL